MIVEDSHSLRRNIFSNLLDEHRARVLCQGVDRYRIASYQISRSCAGHINQNLGSEEVLACTGWSGGDSYRGARGAAPILLEKPLGEIPVSIDIHLIQFPHFLQPKLKHYMDGSLPPSIQDENINDQALLS